MGNRHASVHKASTVGEMETRCDPDKVWKRPVCPGATEEETTSCCTSAFAIRNNMILFMQQLVFLVEFGLCD